jgi:hypothetical protein
MEKYRAIDIAGLDVPAHEAKPLPDLHWIRVSALMIDDTYQRRIERRGIRNIEAIAEEFSWSRFTPLLVAPVENGYAIIDGQHRAHAAALCGYRLVPAMVVEMDAQEQALAFSRVNGHITAVTPTQVYRAALAAGEPWAVNADDAVSAAGCRLMVINASAANKKAGEVYCVAAVRAVIDSGNRKYLTASLKALRACSDADHPVMYSATVLRPWINCLVETGIDDHDTLVAFLNENSFASLLAAVDKMRNTPEYFNKSRAILLQRTLQALLNAYIREVAA